MKKNIKLPTILGIIILSLGLVAGVFLINSRQIFKLGAQSEASPQSVRVSNITDTSVTVTWTTNIETSGFVKWGENISKLNQISSEEAEDKNFIHSMDLIDIKPDSDIFFVIGSNNETYDNNSLAWQAKTNTQPTTQGNSLIATGTILQADAKTPANALVYLSINGIILSNITSYEGSWIIPITNYIASIPESSVIEITVSGGPLGTSQAVIYPKAVKSVPTIVLGKTYDFRTLEANNNNNLPESSVSVPESVDKSSRFEVTKPSETNDANVSLDSIDNGEIITTTDPEFFGKGPAGVTLEVSVESDPQSGTTTTSSNGSWSWSLPSNLEPGEHTVTVKWTDATGIIRTIQRNFVVSASEGPAFESTPSASILPTTKPTSSPVSVSTSSSSPQPVPETGNLTATLGLFIMGLGILLSSIYVWNKEYAET